jgi:hypothetical protein
MTTTEQCIACGSSDLRRDDAEEAAWACNACEYENDRWRQLRARRWYERTVCEAELDGARRLVLPFGGATADRWEASEFSGGVLECGFAGGGLVAFRVTLAAAGFESLFVQGYRPFYDQWSTTYSCVAAASTAEPTAHVCVSTNEDGDERLWVEIDAAGRLVAVSVADEWAESIPWSAMALGGRMFEMDRGVTSDR